MEISASFVADVIKRFRSYKSLGDKTLAQLNEEDIYYKHNEASNSIAAIIQHMYGNMLSRFTNFLIEDGEKSWRKRDQEFEEMGMSKQDLLACWETGWKTVFNAIEALQPDDLLKEITIRSEPLYVYDALLRQLAHYPYHVGQIVYIAKLRKGDAWENLSVPKGGSEAYNDRMMGHK